jgi:hypothetical protein
MLISFLNQSNIHTTPKWTKEQIVPHIKQVRSEPIKIDKFSNEAIVCIKCAKGGSETFSINICVQNASKFTNFPLDEFDGPGSSVGRQKVMCFSSMSTGKSFTFSPSGSYTTNYSKDEFTFTIATRRAKDNGLLKLLRSIQNGDSKWSITVASPLKKSISFIVFADFNGLNGFLQNDCSL